MVVVLPLYGEQVGDGECIEIACCIDEGVMVWAVDACALECDVVVDEGAGSTLNV